MSDKKDAPRTEVLNDFDYDKLEQDWRRKQIGGAPGAAPPGAGPGAGAPGAAPGQEATMALDISGLEDQPAAKAGAAAGGGHPQLELDPGDHTVDLSQLQLPAEVMNATYGKPTAQAGADTSTATLDQNAIEAMLQDRKVIVGQGGGGGAPSKKTEALPRIGPGPAKKTAQMGAQERVTGYTGPHKIPPKKSNTGLIVGLVVMLLLVLGGAVAAVILLTDDEGAEGGPAPGEPTTPATDSATANEAPSLSELWAKARAEHPELETPALSTPIVPGAGQLITATVDEVRIDNQPVGAIDEAVRVASSSLASIIVIDGRVSYKTAYPLLKVVRNSGNDMMLGGAGENDQLNVVLIQSFNWNGEGDAPPPVKLSLGDEGAVVHTPDGPSPQVAVDALRATLKAAREAGGARLLIELTGSATIQHLATALEQAHEGDQAIFTDVLLAAPAE